MKAQSSELEKIPAMDCTKFLLLMNHLSTMCVLREGVVRIA
jgi:hypothetical protein